MQGQNPLDFAGEKHEKHSPRQKNRKSLRFQPPIRGQQITPYYLFLALYMDSSGKNGPLRLGWRAYLPRKNKYNKKEF
jgi:hypothetical protein